MALYAFDGTWNKDHDAGEYGKNTNVVKFRDAYQGKLEFYTKGIGTRYSLAGKVIGGAFGVGGKQRVLEARAALAKNFRAGDRTIDVVGFSRGAALAVDFANEIQAQGVKDPDTGEVVDKKPAVRFVGIWDLVAAFGIPVDIGLPFNRINLGYHFSLPACVAYCFHALALDEFRQAFRPTRVPGAYEVWFRGVHTDVGGGNENAALNNIAFAWMLKKAVAVGLPIVPSAVASAQAGVNPQAPIGKDLDPLQDKPRAVNAGDRVHYTVSARSGHEYNNPPPGCPIESAQDETARVKA
jgi:uncharacterized protein (DUF2235 family)